MSRTVSPGPQEAQRAPGALASLSQTPPAREESASYQCVRCRGPLDPAGDGGGLRCAACEAAFPSVEGVQVLASNPDQVLRLSSGWLPEKRRELEARMAKVRAAFKEGSHSPESLALVERSHEGQLANLDVIERRLEPVRRYLEGRPPTAGFFDAFTGSGWPSLEMLDYFYRDWAGTTEAEVIADLFAGAVGRHCRDRGSVAVLGCGAGRLVHQVAELFGETFGVELAIDTLLLAKTLLDGGRLTLHYSTPRASFPLSTKAVTLEGVSRRSGRVRLLSADAHDLPFRDASLSCVISHYLLDIIPNQRKAAEEIGRVLAPGGVWLDLSLPISTTAADQFNRLDHAAFLKRAGFGLLEESVRRFNFLDLTPLSEWAWTHSQTPTMFAARKVADASPPDRFAEYFAGVSEAVWGLVPRRVVDVTLQRERRFTQGGVGEGHSLVVQHLNTIRSASLAVTPETAAVTEWLLGAIDGARAIGEIFDLMRGSFGEAARPAEVLSFFKDLERSAFVEFA